MRCLPHAAMLLLLGILICCPADSRETSRAARQTSAGDTTQRLTRDEERIRALHQTMATPKRGEWLADHPEDGQTFQQYLKVRPKGLGTDRRKIYIAWLGPQTPQQSSVAKSTGEFLSLFYGMPVQWLDPLAEELIPGSARRVSPLTQKPQFDSIHIIQKVLPKRLPKDAAALLALTATDLWPGNDWNYVFGQGSLGFPTGVFSMNRLAGHDPQKDLLLYRLIKIATHESGHLFGIPHCTAYECGMNGANRLSETDRHPLAFCPECEAKVWLVSGADRIERYRELADFAGRHGFDVEEKLWNESARAIQQTR